MTTKIIATAPSIRFVKGAQPIIVENDGVEYQAGSLSLIGLRSISGVTNKARRYLKDNYDLTDESFADASLTAQGIGNLLMSDEAVFIVACDYTEQLKPADLLEWTEECFNQCFAAVLEANPKFKAQPAGKPDNGQAQPETHNEDGTPKEPGAVSPLE